MKTKMIVRFGSRKIMDVKLRKLKYRFKLTISKTHFITGGGIKKMVSLPKRPSFLILKLDHHNFHNVTAVILNSLVQHLWYMCICCLVVNKL